MSLSNVFNLSTQGMTAQRERLEAAASNLANANSTRSPEGGVYRRRDVVFEADPGPDVAPGDRFDSELEAHFDALRGRDDLPMGVRATTLRSRPDDVVKRFDPDHPDADAEGFVTMPAVDPLEETVNMLSAARSFEANATAFGTAKEMVRTSLKLGEA